MLVLIHSPPDCGLQYIYLYGGRLFFLNTLKKMLVISGTILKLVARIKSIAHSLSQ